MGQNQERYIGFPHRVEIAWSWSPAPDPQADPAYASYREGYGLILDEKWEEARRRFRELISKHPDSRYVEDAQYWSAYALMQTDRKNALDAYRKFINSYPYSGYIDDAIADFTRMQVEALPQIPGTEVPPLPNKGRGKEIEINLRALELDLKNIQLRLNLKTGQAAVRRFSAAPAPPLPPKRLKTLVDTEKLEASVRRNMDSLHATIEHLHNEAKVKALKTIVTDERKPFQVRVHVLQELAEEARPDDHATFLVFKEVALNKQQPLEMRTIAISSLPRFRGCDPLPVLEEVVRRNADEQAQRIALGTIAESEQGRSVNTLINLFEEVPRNREYQQQMILQVIAESNSKRATDYLVKVAQAHENLDVKTAAVLYLSEAGGDKKRSVESLIRLFHSLTPDQTDELHTILYGIANVGNDGAVEFLGNLARTSKDDDLRSDAIYYLSNIGGEKARSLLRKAIEEQ